MDVRPQRVVCVGVGAARPPRALLVRADRRGRGIYAPDHPSDLTHALLGLEGPAVAGGGGQQLDPRRDRRPNWAVPHLRRHRPLL